MKMTDGRRILMTSIVAIALAVPALAAEDVGPRSTVVVSLDGSADWLMAPDARNAGRTEGWWRQACPEAKKTRVPGILQDSLPGYHGVAWYWRDFTPPTSSHAEGRYLLRFWQVDYLADVWVNGIHVGRHEGGEDPFVLDVTDAIRPTLANRLAVRVLNPTHEPIDDIRLTQTPRRNKTYPPKGGCDYNYGGITDSVEVLATPAVRVEDLFVRPDPKTGRIRIQANVCNAGKTAASTRLVFSVAPATSGETLGTLAMERQTPPGDTLVEVELAVRNPRLWELSDPYMYRVSVLAGAKDSGWVDERSTRCGFRDFRFVAGTFQLNGRRVLLKCSHTGCDLPYFRVGVDRELLRRDLVNCKAMGFNAIRFIAGVASRFQLDLCDEIGLMAYEECLAAWCLADSPRMAERFDHATTAMIRRDRNHPSITMWGLLNETHDGAVFRHAVGVLPLVRGVDDTRVVMLSSGRWDKVKGIGSLSNPGMTVWEDVLADGHPYQTVPHTARVIQTMRNMGKDGLPYFWSEHGTGSAVDLARLARHYEQWQRTGADDAMHYRGNLDRFLADWERWKLGDTFASPEEYFRQCVAWMASMRKSDFNAIRANPNVIGYSLTGTQDQGLSGEGLTSTFRELKPGTFDAVFDGWYPLRWCLFVEPVQVIRGRKARLEAVLANEDAIGPGDYPVRFQVVGPRNVSVFDRTITVSIPEPKSKPAPKFALPMFADDVVIDGPAGRYRFLATFQKGAAAAGGDIEFYVADPAEMPKVEGTVVLWGDDPMVSGWLADQKIATRPFVCGARQEAREVILVGARPAPGGAVAFRELAEHMARGSQVVFLSFDVFAKDAKSLTYWLPLAKKGSRVNLPVWLYHKDDWAKNHPVFDGLPTGCILDHTFYREILSPTGFSGQEVPAEVVAGAIDTSRGYDAALTLGVYRLGAGRFVLNTLRIRENLGADPVAQRLLRNMLRYAAREAAAPVAELPTGFDGQLKAMGY